MRLGTPVTGVHARLLRWYAHRVPHRGLFSVLQTICPPSRGSLVVTRVRDATLEVDTRQHLGWRLYFYGVYRPAMIEAITSCVAPGMACVDIGASIGDTTVVIATCLRDAGSVDAFEPFPAEAALCKRNVELNGLGEIVKVHEAAVADRVGAMPLFGPSHGDNPSRSSLAHQRGLDEIGTCQVTTIDRYCDETGLDFLKIDAQGLEMAVLAGAERTVARCQPVIVFSGLCEDLLRASGSSTDGVIEWMTQRGYVVEVLSQNQQESTLLARPTGQRCLVT